jgi:hypothetical protein
LSLDYLINDIPSAAEVEEIAKQWNNDDFQFYDDLEVSVFLSFLSRSSYSHLSIFSTGFLDSEWLNEKFNNDEIRHEKPQLSLDMNFS